MVQNQNAAYSPYGAYELKATYQRNLLTSNLTVIALVTVATLVLIIVTLPKTADIIDDPFVPIEISPELIEPPSIRYEQPQIRVRPPKSELPVIGPMVPVDDEEFLDSESEIKSIENYADVSDFGDDLSDDFGYDYDYQDGIGEMPGVNTFVPDVQISEFIYKALPEYPRMEKLAGFEGVVWIAVEVDIDGSVTRAKIYVTSGRDSFDKAALAVAYKNKFRSAIQNGTPVKLWTAYKVEFVLKE